MPEYLKSKQEYIDRYDKQTVEKCRKWLNEEPDKEYVAKEAKRLNLPEKEAIRCIKTFNEVYVYFYKGERYIGKEETINEWMRVDEQRDKLLETAHAPENITCIVCGRLTFMSSKHLNIGFNDEPDRVLFFYDCPLKHIPHRAFYNDGKEFKREKPVCPKCGTQIVEEDKDTDAMFLTIQTCPKCGNVERIEIERMTNKLEQPDPDFEKDRAQYCLSDKEGLEFIREKALMKDLERLRTEADEKEKNKDLYEKVANLKRLKIVELEQMLAPILEKEDYVKLQFKNPETGKDIAVPFVVYDQKPDRSDQASIHDLEAVLKKALRDTNWRLMSEGVNYRLGMLEGRFHGYEKEEDLVNLLRLQDKKEAKKKS